MLAHLALNNRAQGPEHSSQNAVLDLYVLLLRANAK